jgi:hypothetical protein
MLMVLALAVLALAGCVVEPYGGGRGGYYGGYDYGHRVWR